MPTLTLATDSFADSAALACFQLASRLTDPICKARENYVWIYVVDKRYPSASTIAKWAEKFFSALRVAVWGFISVVASPFGMGFRWLGTKIAPHSFTHLSVKGKAGSDRFDRITILLYNECNVDGGYSMTDGGVVPKGYRFERNTEEIKKQNAEVICSCEIFDVNTALERAKKIAPFYKNIYLNMNPQPVGTSSALFFATKFDTRNPFFTRFPPEMLVGRTKHAGKGYFSVEIGKNNPQFQKIASVFHTHLQHSEIPEKTKNIKLEDRSRREEEEKARLSQMDFIISHMEKVEGPAILAGDLNIEEEEYNASPWKNKFIRVHNQGECTWGGDRACVELINEIFRKISDAKPFSNPLNLDYILVLRKPNDQTTIASTQRAFDTHFKGDKFTVAGDLEALSDHYPQRAEIVL